MSKTNTDSYYYAAAEGHGLAHDPVKAIVAPRPIGWISTVDLQGRPNLAPYSFFNMFSSNPQILGFSSEGRKDSLRNAEDTGEFVWNLATRDLAKAMNLTSGRYDRGVDEFVIAGLTPATSRCVSAPRVAESPASLECKVVDIVRLRTLEGSPMNCFLVLGQIVGVHISPRYLKDGLFDTFAAQPIMRGGYQGEYAHIGDKFEMQRPD